MADGGPYVQAALVCERALQEPSGIVSPIRIIDRVFFITGEDGQPVQRQHPITIVVMLKAGNARGGYTLYIEREKPSMERTQIAQATVLFEGDDRGVQMILEAGFEPDEPGVYWLDVLLEAPEATDLGKDLLTRIPLRAIFQAMPTVGPGE